jgi:translation initiation factor IF-2
VGEEFLAGESAAVEDFSKNKFAEVKELAVDVVAAQEAGEIINIVLKADETASLEALKGLVLRIPLGFTVKIVNESVGDLTENDVKLAINTGAIIVGFRMKIDRAASNLASTQKVLILESPIIYELENSIRAYAKKILPKEMRRLEVLAVFGDSKGKERVVGGKVVLGPIKNQEPFEIWQDKKLVGTGKIKNLQSQRKDIQEAETGIEAGMLVESNEPIKVGHQLLFSDASV